MNYTINLTQTEDSALSYVTTSQLDWIENAVKERCRHAIEDIVQLTVQKCLETNTQIPGSKEEIVALAFEQGWVKTAIQRNSEIDTLIDQQAAE